MIAIPNMDKPKFCKCEEYNCFAWDDEKFKCKITEWKKPCPLIDIVQCKDCKHRDPEDKKCDCGMFERQGCIFPVADDYFCKYGERRSDESNT